MIAAMVAWAALGRGGLPKEAGAPPDAERLHRPVLGPISAESAVYLGTLVALGLFVLLVSGFALFTDNGRPMMLISEESAKRLASSESALVQILGVFVEEMSRPAGLVLLLAGLGAVVYLAYETIRLEKVPRQRMLVVFILTFFSFAGGALID